MSARWSRWPGPGGTKVETLRVAIDICRLTDPWTGIGNYIANLLAGLAQVDQNNDYILYPYFPECFPQKVAEMARFVPEAANFSLWGQSRPELLVKLLWFKLKLPKEWFLTRADVTHSPNQAGKKDQGQTSGGGEIQIGEKHDGVEIRLVLDEVFQQVGHIGPLAHQPAPLGVYGLAAGVDLARPDVKGTHPAPPGHAEAPEPHALQLAFPGWEMIGPGEVVHGGGGEHGAVMARRAQALGHLAAVHLGPAVDPLAVSLHHKTYAHQFPPGLTRHPLHHYATPPAGQQVGSLD